MTLVDLPAEQSSLLVGALALGPAVQAERFAVAVATSGVIASAAEREPLLVLVDDAHWLDAASLEALLFSQAGVGSANSKKGAQR